MSRKRNTVRFLIPKAASANAFHDRDLLILARAVVKAEEWRKEDSEYGKLQTKYQSELRGILRVRFDRFAVLDTWNYQEPAKCQFHVENHGAQGGRIPDAIDDAVRQNLFIPEDFQDLVMAQAQDSDTVAKLLRELSEPRPNGQPCIPWLGEIDAKERLMRVCARGLIALQTTYELLQHRAGEDAETAYNRMKAKIPAGKNLEETYILLPEAVPAAGGVNPPPVSATAAQPPTLFPTIPPGNPGAVPSSPGEAPSSTPGSLFGGPAIAAPEHFHAPATSSLNLLGKAEAWGIGPATSLRNVHLKLDRLTGAQLQKLLKGLPDGFQYELDLDKEQG